jgi:hypothetical protein
MATRRLPVLLLYCVVSFFFFLGFTGILGVVHRSAWGTNLLALPIALGLIAYRPLWRTIAIAFLGCHVLFLVTYSCLLLFSRQEIRFVSPQGLGLPANQEWLAAGLLLFWVVATYVVAIMVLKSREIRELFTPASEAPPTGA